MLVFLSHDNLFESYFIKKKYIVPFGQKYFHSKNVSQLLFLDSCQFWMYFGQFTNKTSFQFFLVICKLRIREADLLLETFFTRD